MENKGIPSISLFNTKSVEIYSAVSHRERQGQNWVHTGSWLKVLFSVLLKFSDTQQGERRSMIGWIAILSLPAVVTSPICMQDYITIDKK